MQQALTDADVEDACRAFGSTLRVALLRHYREHPGTQAAACLALGESSANTSRNTQVLISTGAVIVTIKGPTRLYSIDTGRITHLTSALTRCVFER